MRRMLVFIIFSIAFTLFTTPITFAPQPQPTPENYEVTFIGVIYDVSANTSTWTYNITCKGPPAISHFDFEFKTVCDPPLTSILEAYPEPWEIVNPDPTTEVTGLKFDIPVEEGETIQIWFKLEGLWDANDMEVWIKAGHQDSYEGPSYLPPGPACFVIPEVPLGPIATILAAFAAFGLVAKKN